MSDGETMGLKAAAGFIRIHPQTLMERARAGIIPGAAKPGKEWVFLKVGLVAYLGSLSPCQSTKSVISGTSTYRQSQAGLDALLGLPTKGKRKPTTTRSGVSYGD